MEDLIHRNVKFMIIDDNEIDILILRRTIEHTPMQASIEEFIKPEKALDILIELDDKSELEQLPDLIFLDINMPVLNGFQFLDRINLLKHVMDKCKVFMLTSSVSVSDKIKSASYPCVAGFFMKPFLAEDLQMVKRICTDKDFHFKDRFIVA